MLLSKNEDQSIQAIVPAALGAAPQVGLSRSPCGLYFCWNITILILSETPTLMMGSKTARHGYLLQTVPPRHVSLMISLWAANVGVA